MVEVCYSLYNKIEKDFQHHKSSPEILIGWQIKLKIIRRVLPSSWFNMETCVIIQLAFAFNIKPFLKV